VITLDIKIYLSNFQQGVTTDTYAYNPPNKYPTTPIATNSHHPLLLELTAAAPCVDAAIGTDVVAVLASAVVCDITADVITEGADIVVELTAEAVLVADASRVALVAAFVKLVTIEVVVGGPSCSGGCL